MEISSTSSCRDSLPRCWCTLLGEVRVLCSLLDSERRGKGPDFFDIHFDVRKSKDTSWIPHGIYMEKCFTFWIFWGQPSFHVEKTWAFGRRLALDSSPSTMVPWFRIRQELARNATGENSFQPGHVVLQAGPRHRGSQEHDGIIGIVTIIKCWVKNLGITWWIMVVYTWYTSPPVPFSSFMFHMV